MVDINRVILLGRLTRDAELKMLSNGQSVCKFSIAVNRRKRQGEQWVDEANFFDIVLWGRQGETLSQYLVKGKQVAIDGELRQDRWEQDGQNRSKIEIIANNLQLLGGGSGGGSGGGGSGAPRSSGGSSYGSGGGSFGGGGGGYGERDDYSRDTPTDAPFTDDVPF
jgi:single-strand DNA-binding protein